MSGQFGILRQHTFRHVFLGRAVSLLGTAIAPIALAFAMLGQPGGSATKLGFVMASEAVAQVVFLLVGGVLADRFSRYRLMVGSDLIAFAAQGSIAGLFISRAAPLGLIAALSAVTGAASGIFYPSPNPDERMPGPGSAAADRVSHAKRPGCGGRDWDM